MAETEHTAAPEAATVQWCINQLSALIAERISERRRKNRTHDDEVIAASARYLAACYVATKEAKAEGSSHA